MYTAELKCPVNEPKHEKQARVKVLLEELALSDCANTVIGDALARGISGGQVGSSPPWKTPSAGLT